MTSVKMKGANIYPRQFYKIKINENIRFTVALLRGLVGAEIERTLYDRRRRCVPQTAKSILLTEWFAVSINVN